MKRTEKAELIAMAVSVFMAAGMISVFFLSRSLSILAEGLDTVFDIIASAAVLAGLRISDRKTRTFPSGLYKVENLVAVMVGILILFGAYELCREAIGRLSSEPVPLDHPWLVVIVMSIVVVITAALAWYKGKVGREEYSPSLKADSRHSWTDVIASSGIVVGILLQIMGIEIMDALTALLIS
ncbi:MAG: cation diffusion facilitator family transporter, partial [Actinobacteria bacterium]|nr:cation diffusion facilitator family transporter [Actinomycetota bacterium]